MSTLTLQERFELDSDPERVWSFLTDPRRAVTCLPGAEITGQEDERTYQGALKVKVGAVQIAYRGTVVLEEIDAIRQYVRVAGKGREKTGSGSAEMTMESRVSALDGGRTEVTVDAEVRVTGKIVRFGRGMIETVSAEILAEFRERLAARLERNGGHGGPDSVRSTSDAATAGRGDDQALQLLPLLLRALRSWLRRLFGRR